MTVLEPARQDEAIASIDATLYQQLWAGNNLGRMQKELATGSPRRKAKAQETITHYRRNCKKPKRLPECPCRARRLRASFPPWSTICAMPFQGHAVEQEEKRNRAAKEHHQKSFKGQRSY